MPLRGGTLGWAVSLRLASRLAAMTVAYRRPGGRARLPRLILVVAALAGLFAMHGLGDHGTMHHEPTGDLMGSLAATSHAEDAMSASAALDPAHDDGSAPEGAGTGIVGLCLAVLTGALLGLAWLRARSGRLVIERWTPRDTWSLSAAPRDRDAPSPFRLSIQRC